MSLQALEHLFLIDLAIVRKYGRMCYLLRSDFIMKMEMSLESRKVQTVLDFKLVY